MARRKPFETPARVGSGRVGLAVMRMQPVHRGHTRLVQRMIEDCDTVIVGFGSCQLAHTTSNPFSFEERLAMLRSVFGEAFKPLQLVDIDSNIETNDWVTYVLSKVAQMNLPEPTDYYSGSIHDAGWYESAFAGPADAVLADDALVTSFERAGRRLHVLKRDASGIPPASTLRSMIERRTEDWQAFVPARLVPFVEYHYPPHLRMAIKAASFPEDVAPGTKVLRVDEGPRALYRLAEDGHWTALPER